MIYLSGWFLRHMPEAIVLGFVVGLGAALLRGERRDDSDPPSGFSGLTASTDALTGCQYLSTPAGGITPRLGPDGRQICKATK